MREIRRKEYAEDRTEVIEEIVDQVRFGQLGLLDAEGWPIVRPMNFARVDGAVYFHGAREGEKSERLEGPATVRLCGERQHRKEDPITHTFSASQSTAFK